MLIIYLNLCNLITTAPLPPLWIELDDFLLVGTSLGVRGIPLKFSLQEDVILPLSGISGSFSGSAMEFDGNDGTIFYNDRSRGLIYKSNLDGTGAKSYITMPHCWIS